MKYLTTTFFCAAIFATAAYAKPPAELDTMRQAFSAALAGKHIDVAMKMTRFPLIQEVYKAPPKVTSAQFAKELGNMGLDDSGIQKCIAHDPAELTGAKDVSNKGYIGAWNVNCDGNVFYFTQVSGAWMFIGYENINE